MEICGKSVVPRNFTSRDERNTSHEEGRWGKLCTRAESFRGRDVLVLSCVRAAVAGEKLWPKALVRRGSSGSGDVLVFSGARSRHRRDHRAKPCRRGLSATPATLAGPALGPSWGGSLGRRCRRSAGRGPRSGEAVAPHRTDRRLYWPGVAGAICAYVVYRPTLARTLRIGSPPASERSIGAVVAEGMRAARFYPSCASRLLHTEMLFCFSLISTLYSAVGTVYATHVVSALTGAFLWPCSR